MKIAQLAPIIERTPPKKYEWTEKLASILTDEFVKCGPTVILIANGNPIIKANPVSVFLRVFREAKIRNFYGFNTCTLLNSGLAYVRS